MGIQANKMTFTDHKPWLRREYSDTWMRGLIISEDENYFGEQREYKQPTEGTHSTAHGWSTVINPISHARVLNPYRPL